MAVKSLAVIVGLLVGISLASSKFVPAQDNSKGGKLVIDTDGSADDAIAILMALEAEALGEGPKVVAITCVNGNTEIDNVVIAVLKTLKIADRLDVPVYRGAARTMLLKNEYNRTFYGQDGFGDFVYPDPPSIALVKDTHAVLALIDLVKANPGQITILCIAPPTNIALAILMYPTFLDGLHEFIIMTATVEGIGNVRPGIDSNAFVDPPSNFVVFNAAEKSKPVVLVPLEACIRSSLPMSFRRCLSSFKNEKMWLVDSAEEPSLHPEPSLWNCPDAVAAAVAISYGSVNTRTSSYHLEAIYEGELTRGMTVVDYSRVSGKPDNVILVQDINVEAYKKMLLKYLA